MITSTIFISSFAILPSKLSSDTFILMGLATNEGCLPDEAPLSVTFPVFIHIILWPVYYYKTLQHTTLLSSFTNFLIYRSISTTYSADVIHFYPSYFWFVNALATFSDQRLRQYSVMLQALCLFSICNESVELWKQQTCNFDIWNWIVKTFLVCTILLVDACKGCPAFLHTVL